MEQLESVYTGGCLCAAVRYEARGIPHEAQLCHCRMCQRASGAPMLAFASFERNAFRWTRGEPRVYRSSQLALRSFCPQCGSSLAFEYAAGDRTVGVTLASLDEPHRIVPAVHWGVESMLPWIRMADDWPRRQTEDDPEWQAARAALSGGGHD